MIMDIQMPKMDGYEAVATLRKQNYPSPVIALTAHAMEGEKERCSDSGFDEYLTKPVDVRVLIETVKRLAALHKTKKEDRFSLLDKLRILSSSSKVKTILERFVQNIPQEISGIRDAYNEEDWDKLVSLIHRFKGTAASCGFVELSDKAICLEDALLMGKRDATLWSLYSKFR